MVKLNVDAINKVSISGAGDCCHDIKPLWLIATDNQNTDTLNCRYHNHAFFELHIITSGRLGYGFGGSELSLSEGQFTVIAPKCRHKVLSHSENVGKFTVAFEVDEKSSMFLAVSSMLGKAYDLNKADVEKLKEVLELFDRKHIYKREKLFLAVSGLLFEIAEHGDCRSEALPRRADCDDRVFKAKKYIEDNYDVFLHAARWHPIAE